MVMISAIPDIMARQIKPRYAGAMATRGDRLRSARRAARISQEELAGRLGVSQPTISLWEQNQRPISADQLKKLAENLGVSVGYILYGGELTEQAENATLDDQRAGAYVPMVTLRSVALRESPGSSTPRIRASFPCSSSSYAFELPDDSNGPMYPKGSRSIWDPEEAPQPGAMVLALADGSPVIGELLYETTPTGPVTIIAPLNRRWPAARSDFAHVELLAVMTENTRLVPR